MIITNKNAPDYLFTCSKCGLFKENKLFRRKLGQRRVREYSSQCLECLSKTSSNWGKNNPEKRKAIQSKYNLKHKKELAERGVKWRCNSPFKSMLGSYRQNAARRNLTLDITHIDLENLWVSQKGLCYYTNKPMLKRYGSRESVSIDRIDSFLGYTLSNIVLCRRQVNIMKNDASIEELLIFCKDVLNTLS